MLPINGIVNGTYQVIKEIGHGGIGVVYLGYHLHLKKYIVLKRIVAGSWDMEALRREADIMKNLRHTNIPQIYDFVIENNEVYTVMEYIEGQSLDKYVRGANSISEDQLVGWFRELADVLVYLGSRKPAIIHSDIKPENIIITPQGNPVLIDFNIAIDQNASGKIEGISPYYSSPEQNYMAQQIMAGNPVDYALDQRTDIYSLGAVFYTMVTGFKPDGRYVLNKLENTSGFIYSQPFLTVIDRCTEWDRNARFKDARSLMNALTDLRKMDRNYQKFIAMRIAGWVLSALLIIAGNYCIIHGYQIHIQEMSDGVSELTATGDYKAAAEEAQRILRMPASGIMLRGEDKAKLYHVIGNSCSINRNYAGSARAYEQAIHYLPKFSEKASGYYSDLAMSYLNTGKTEMLKKCLDDCDKAGITGNDLELVRAAYYSETGNREECIKITDKIIGTSGVDREITAKAYLIRAECADQNGEKIEFYRKARDNSNDDYYDLVYAYTLMDSGQYSDAAMIYRELSEKAGGQSDDLLKDLGSALLNAGQYQECITEMEKISDKDDFEVNYILALAYYNKFDSEGNLDDLNKAADYCRRARVLFNGYSAGTYDRKLSDGLNDLENTLRDGGVYR